MTAFGLLLAAGRSRRFGPRDKLLAALRGRPLVCHAAEALAAADVGPLLAVVEDADVAALLPDYRIVAPAAGAPSQSASLRAGVAAAEASGAARVIVVLADMPFVTPALIRAVSERGAHGPGAMACDGATRLPPACLPASAFAAVRRLSGDRGAGTLLRGLPPEALVAATAEELRDIDVAEDLERLEGGAR